MVESIDDYLTRKMMEVQNLIQEATEAKAIMNPIVTDGFDQAMGANISIQIRINESKLNEFRKLKSQ